MKSVVKPILLLAASLVLVLLVFLSGVIITANVIAEPEPHRFANMETPDLWTTQPKAVDPSKQAYQRVAPTTDTASIANEPPKPTGASPAPTPAQTATDTAAVTTTDPDRAAPASDVDNTTTASIDPQPDDAAEEGRMDMADQSEPGINAEQAAWCYARYRSYRIEDNSYQPYSGGARRQCEAPGISVDSSNTENVAAARQGQQDEQAPPVPEEPVYGDEPDYEADSGYAEQQTVDNGAQAGAHEEWCFSRYRSYQVEDNSYQPFDGGPRRACQSPYG